MGKKPKLRKKLEGAAAAAPRPPKPPENKPNAGAGAGDPLALLRYEHRALASLFGEFAVRKDEQLARRICSQVTLHSKLEEEDLYGEAEDIPDIFDRATR